MEIMTMMTFLLASWSLAMEQSTDVAYTKQASVGDSVVLPCPCSGMPMSLVWQTASYGVVVYYHQNKIEKSVIDKAYINRTQLFLHMDKSNCSLLLHNASLMDSGLYNCYVITKVDQGVSHKQSLQINLTVYETENGTQDIHKGGDSKDISSDLSSVHIGVPILAVLIILAAGLLLTQTLRRRRRRNQNVYAPATVPLTDV